MRVTAAINAFADACHAQATFAPNLTLLQNVQPRLRLEPGACVRAGGHKPPVLDPNFRPTTRLIKLTDCALRQSWTLSAAKFLAYQGWIPRVVRRYSVW